MSCKNERLDFCVIEGVNDSLIFTISDIDLDPLGYEIVIGDNTYTGANISAVVDGDGVEITCPILEGDFNTGVYEGYFKTLTKNQGVYEQFKIKLVVTEQYGN